MHTPALILLGLAATCAASDLFTPKHSHAKRDGMTKTRCKKRNVGARADSAPAPLFTPTSKWQPGDDKAAVVVKGVAAGVGVSVDTSSLLAATSNFAGDWVKRNCVYWGWLPADYQKLDQNGELETPKVADQIVGTNAKYFGMYAHMYGNKYKQGDSSTYFDGKEILHWTDYLQGTGAIPVLSVMPVYGFNGMTKDDNTQAVALAKVVKHFADAGFEPYLRWGHEMNWYFHPNSDDDRTGASFYQGSAQDYINAWRVVHDTVKAMVPNAKMYWCPIRAWDDNSNYAQYWPGASYVDVVGVDYYPNTTDDYNQVAKYVQDIHDTYAKPYGYPFHIGETGTTLDASTKIHWADVVTSKATCSALTNLNAVHWFDHYRDMDGGDFRLLSDSGIANRFSSLMETS